MRAELKGFTDWLTANGAKGYIGEVGWPSGADAAQWQLVESEPHAEADPPFRFETWDRRRP